MLRHFIMRLRLTERNFRAKVLMKLNAPDYLLSKDKTFLPTFDNALNKEFSLDLH